MQKNKRPAPKKSAPSPEELEEALTQSLVDLAIGLIKHSGKPSASDAVKEKRNTLEKNIRKCLYQKKDDVLYEALERTLDEDTDAYLLLKESIEEASGVIVSRRDDGRELEVNAFLIPLFAHTKGGLHIEQCFQDEEAFELLRKSFQELQLESRDAKLVLVSHAYHLDEIDRISYSQLNEMVHEALESMTRKKAAAVAISRSISGWPENHFAPEDQAVELRFLLGFALKTMDDPFYRVPAGEAAADRYFEARAKRFQHWTQQAAPLVKRCLVTDGSEIEIDFLYQDLFHGGKERGITEYDTLQMMSDLHHGLQLHGILPANTHAIIGPMEADGEMVLRVNLYAKTDGTLLASSEKQMDAAVELQREADDVYDALTTIGVKSLALAMKFDADGVAIDVRPYGDS
ncbi:MAG TPA: DUF2863 family protein [Noviherbaspirillum sp.]|nr:DUF2863 family protein [Noviherbaspirillum sp.]